MRKILVWTFIWWNRSKFTVTQISPDQWTVEAKEGYVLIPCGNGTAFRIAKKA